MDSPHSSCVFPKDFNADLPLEDLRDGEDVFIDALWPMPQTMARTCFWLSLPAPTSTPTDTWAMSIWP